MKKTTYLLVVLVAVTMLASGLAFAAHHMSAETGQKLFSDAKLGGGTKGKSCDSCHPGGKGLEGAGAKKNLEEMINTCIEGPVGGKKLDPKSAEMAALKAYIMSLGKKPAAK